MRLDQPFSDHELGNLPPANYCVAVIAFSQSLVLLCCCAEWRAQRLPKELFAAASEGYPPAVVATGYGAGPGGAEAEAAIETTGSVFSNR